MSRVRSAANGDGEDIGFQLILQFSGDTFDDFDHLVELEDMLRYELGDSGLVDGHDFGSGQMNIFILTASPRATFEVVKATLAPTRLTKLKAAYRSLATESYTILWPEEWTGPFIVL